MRIPRPAAEKLGVVRQDADVDGLLFGLISRAPGGKILKWRQMRAFSGSVLEWCGPLRADTVCTVYSRERESRYR